MTNHKLTIKIQIIKLLTILYTANFKLSIQNLKFSDLEVRGGENMAIEKMQRTTLTAKEAAEYLGISYWLITQLVKRKQIPCSRVGKRILFRKEALDIYLSKKENDSIKESC